MIPAARSSAIARTARRSIFGIAGGLFGALAFANDSSEIIGVPPAPTERPSDQRDSPDRPGASRPVRVGETPSSIADRSGLNRPLSDLKASIKPTDGDLPKSFPLVDPQGSNESFLVYQNRPWPFANFEWEAPATRHLPLLFEEPNLERLGYGYGLFDVGLCEEGPHRGQRLQTVVSGVNFFGRIPFLPYMAHVRPLTDPVYTLGTDRPGSPVPYRKY
jgi:hypothetical protein